MVVLREPGELFALRHTFGLETISWVERLDPDSLDTHALKICRRSNVARRPCGARGRFVACRIRQSRAPLDAIVVLDIESGEERVRVDSGSAVQSVVFPAAGVGRDFYYCSFAAITRVGYRA
jgi:hypothetical protein